MQALTDKPVRDALAAALADEFYFDPDAKFDEMSLEDGVPDAALHLAGWRERTSNAFDLVLAATGRRAESRSRSRSKTRASN